MILRQVDKTHPVDFTKSSKDIIAEIMWYLPKFAKLSQDNLNISTSDIYVGNYGVPSPAPVIEGSPGSKYSITVDNYGALSPGPGFGGSAGQHQHVPGGWDSPPSSLDPDVPMQGVSLPVRRSWEADDIMKFPSSHQASYPYILKGFAFRTVTK